MEIKIFLLGGCDLEMREITALLQQECVLWYDRHLNWANADLSAYAEELQIYGNLKEVQIYGVELQNDLREIPYHNYFRIDHHNDYSGHPSALEQIARILGVELTWRQKLIAANDTGYIPAMQRLGASPEEIAEIRMADLKMQGCTDEDEQLAEEAVKTLQRRQGNLILVKALSPRFSPICDRLWPYEKLLIYTDSAICYYGRGKESLVEQFQTEIAQGKMYYGGGENGFWGVAENEYTPEEIRHLVQVCEDIVVQV